ncbi:MAG TPA: hypothetical protein PKY82_17065 [Pyrinomonadaceae bacterium]|nr:hypothetical protein [Pyrinomonadaceae bacterium]
MLKKSLLALLISLLFSLSVFADQISYVTKEKADRAVETLSEQLQIKHFCAPCRDKVAISEDVKKVEAVVSSEPAPAGTSKHPKLWEVKVNNVGIDFAYVYVQTLSNQTWRNIGIILSLPVEDVPEFLPASALGNPAKPVFTPTPAPTYNPPPVADSNLGKWTPVVEMDNQIFPSYYLATATQPRQTSKLERVIGDSAGKIGMHIINPKENTKLKFTFSIDPVISYQEFETTLKTKGDYYQIYPFVVWNWEALKKYKKPTPANAKFQIFLDGQLVGEKTIVVRIRSINESVLAYSYFLDDDRWADTSWSFAAYVNEDHEWIDQLLKEALDTKIINSFTGYQEDSKKVLLQAFAIWYILQKRGFKYSSITKTSGSGTSEKVFSQYVRLFDDAIKTSQANCVDGTVLMASILKKIGFRVALVNIPGHCFLAFDLTGKGDWRGLETTMMGNVDLDSFGDEKSKADASLKNFLEAINTGTATLSESISNIKAGKTQYNFVNIDEARQNGIFPISW